MLESPPPEAPPPQSHPGLGAAQKVKKGDGTRELSGGRGGGENQEKTSSFCLRTDPGGFRTSRPSMANVSVSSWCVVATRGHINSTPPTTCLQLAGRSNALGQPSSSSSPAPKSTISKDLRADSASSEAVSRGGLKLGTLEGLQIKAASSGVFSG
jgi:hypothetical protein